jgi:lipid A 3-O-deacylase
LKREVGFLILQYLGKVQMERCVKVFSFAVLFIFVAWAGRANAGEDDPAFINLGVGYFDLFDDDNAGEFRAEYRAADRYWIFKPFVGISLTSDRAVHGYAGVLSDFYFGRRIVVTPSVAGGYYDKGDGKDLGHEFEIRSGMEIAYRFDNRSRLGIGFYHISNAGLEDTKPGVEIVGLNFSIPFRY